MALDLSYLNSNQIVDKLYENSIANGLIKRKFTKGRLGLLYSAIGQELELIVGILNSYTNQFSLDSCTDPALLESLLKPIVTRRVASKARAVLTFTRDNGYSESVRIPSGFAVKTSGGITFVTNSDVYLWKGTNSVKVMAYSLNTGSKYNVGADTLTSFTNSSNWNVNLSVTNEYPAFGGLDDESLTEARLRANGFRYERDGTLQDIRNQIYLLGYEYRGYRIEEYIDGYGTVLIALDCDSDEAFEDLCTLLNMYKVAGISYHFARVTRKYVNFYVDLQITGAQTRTPAEQESLHNSVESTVQTFFTNYIGVGDDVSISYLINNLNTAIASSDVYNISITVDDNIKITDKNKILVQNTERIYPNQITTNIVTE